MFYLTLYRRACHLSLTDRAHSSQGKGGSGSLQHKVITFFLSHYTDPECPEMRRLFFKREKYGDVKDRGGQRGGSPGRIEGGWGTGSGRKDF